MYQLLKFNAYYGDNDHPLKVRGALVANLDPLFLADDYLTKLRDVRWGRSQDFVARETTYKIEMRRLHYLYDAILAFNYPVINDPDLTGLFDFSGFHDALVTGRLDGVLESWQIFSD